MSDFPKRKKKEGPSYSYYLIALFKQYVAKFEAWRSLQPPGSTSASGGGRSDDYAHCMWMCETTNQLGSDHAFIMGLRREIDSLGDTSGHTPQAAVEDLFSNMQGIMCAELEQDCEECCGYVLSGWWRDWVWASLVEELERYESFITRRLRERGQLNELRLGRGSATRDVTTRMTPHGAQAVSRGGLKQSAGLPIGRNSIRAGEGSDLTTQLPTRGGRADRSVATSATGTSIRESALRGNGGPDKQ
jgi:hypothetical protein